MNQNKFTLVVVFILVILANKIYFIHQLMLVENPGYTEEDVYKYIFWSGTNKILDDLANNVQNDNPES